MAAAKLDLKIQQGSTFVRDMTLKDGAGNPISLLGCLIRGQIRPTATDGTVLASFVCTITDTALGKASFALTSDQTSAIPAVDQTGPSKKIAQYAWDLEIVYSDQTVERLLEGIVYLSPEVTR